MSNNLTFGRTGQCSYFKVKVDGFLILSHQRSQTFLFGILLMFQNGMGIFKFFERLSLRLRVVLNSQVQCVRSYGLCAGDDNYLRANFYIVFIEIFINLQYMTHVEANLNKLINLLLYSCWKIKNLFIKNIKVRGIIKIQMSDNQSDSGEEEQVPQNKMESYNDHKAKMMPLIRFLRKRGLKFKHANVQNVRVEYFRMDNLQELIDQNKKEISEDSNLKALIDEVKGDLIYLKRPSNQEKRKYPQTLEHVNEGKSGKFAAFKFDTTQSRKSLLIGLVILIVAAVLFPLWPYELKYGAWLLSFSTLVFLLSIIIIRLMIYVLFAILGLSLWVFPNLFGDKGPIQSFKPFYSIQKWDTDKISLIGRVLAFSLFAYYGVSIYRDPDFYLENLESTKNAMGEFHDWGVDKIKGETNFSQRAISVEKILNDTAQAYEDEVELKIENENEVKVEDESEVKVE